MSTEQELKELMNLVQDIKDYGCPQDYAALESRLRAILAELEAAREDAERVDWLEQSKEHHGFCGTGYGEYRYYAGQCDGWGSVRKTIDAARKGEA